MLVALGAAGVLGTSWVYTASGFFADYGAGGEIFGLGLAAPLAVCIALAYAELASRFPRAGGEIVFAYVAFGRPVSFAAGWLLIGAFVSSLAFYVSASGMLLARLYPELNTLPLYAFAGTQVYLPQLAVGVILAVFFAALDMRKAGGLQLFMFAVMLVIGFLLAFVGFSSGQVENFWPAFRPDQDPLLSTVRFVLPAMTFLTGFSLVTTLSEDADLSPRKIAWAVVLTVVIAAVFYCTVLLATAWIIPWQTTAALQDGVIDAFLHAGHPELSRAAFGIAVLGLLTSFLALFAAASRVVVGLARAGLFPGAFARLSRKGRPVNALLFTLALTLALGWMGKGALLWFLDTGGVYIGLAWVIAVLSLYRIRRLYPAESAPYRAWPDFLPAFGGLVAFLVIMLIVFPGTALSLVWPQEYLILLFWLVLGFGIYLLIPGKHARGSLEAVVGRDSGRWCRKPR